MSRHLRTPRLNSGVLFSPPAPIDAPVDVWCPEPGPMGMMDQSRSNLQGIPSAPRPVVARNPQDGVGGFAGFPRFFEASNIKAFAKRFPGSGKPESGPITLCLPTLSISADVLIDGTISLTTLTQSYHNPSELMIPEARHTFPLYDGAVVTSFECRVGDARRLQGVVKPTAQAKREFEKSKAKREAAALLEELAPELFETSLGNIPPNTKVEIILTYVHELKVVTSQEEKAEGLALTIPTSIAPQYTTPLPELPRDKLEITIRVLDDGTIDAAACHVESNHAVKYEGSQPLIANIGELGNINLPAGGAQKMQHVWQYSSNAQLVLGSDFVLVIQMRQETRLHSRAVIAPANEYGHAALMVSLRPNDIFGSAVNPQLFKGEILFILDQSGSMGWTQSARDQRLKIDTMKNAMSLALSGLPSTCRFNIISFGSEVRGMWLRSRGADEPANLPYAMEYLDTVGANMGGTEILLALKGAVNNCEPSLPSTQIILITDGEVHHEPHDAIMEFVWETRQKFGEKIRFFTLGIGDRVSHRVVEGIAELGGGYCDVVDVVKKPRWEDRVNRMLRSVMEPDSWSCEIDLGPGFERRSLAACQFGADNRPDSHLALYVQGPHPIPSLSPYRYKSFFFLLDMGSAELPTTLTIRTTTDAAKKKVYDMHVKPAQLRAGTIHPLAVKMALQSLENEVKGIDANKEQARINAEILGTKYSISSKWTSFVAVADESRDLAHPIEVYKSVFKEANKQIFFGSERGESIWKAIPGFPIMEDRPGKVNTSQSLDIMMNSSTQFRYPPLSMPSYSFQRVQDPHFLRLVPAFQLNIEESSEKNGDLSAASSSKNIVMLNNNQLNGSSNGGRVQIVGQAQLNSPNQSWVDVDNILEANKRSDKDGKFLFGSAPNSPPCLLPMPTDGENSLFDSNSLQPDSFPLYPDNSSSSMHSDVVQQVNGAQQTCDPAPRAIQPRLCYDSQVSQDDFVIEKARPRRSGAQYMDSDSEVNERTNDTRGSQLRYKGPRGNKRRRDVNSTSMSSSDFESVPPMKKGRPSRSNRPPLERTLNMWRSCHSYSNNGGSTENDEYPSMYAAASIDEASKSERNCFRRSMPRGKSDIPKCVIPETAENVHTDEVTAAETLAVTDPNIRVPESCGPWAFEETMLSQPLSPIFAATNNAPEESSPFLNLGPADFNTWADVPWQDKEATSYEPSRDGPITWEDVVGCEKSGMFVLPNVVRERLGQHFCGKTVERLQETLRNLSDAAKVAKQDVAVLTDTLMMIQYCKTHLATQEDYWSLVIGKAERAVLLALGYDQDREEALEPWYEKLLSAIFHMHFQESLRHASINKGEGDTAESLGSLSLKTCLVCDTSIETDCEGRLATSKGFMCLADECYDSKTHARSQYSDWTAFWEHQVKSGHMLCPGIMTGRAVYIK